MPGPGLSTFQDLFADTEETSKPQTLVKIGKPKSHACWRNPKFKTSQKYPNFAHVLVFFCFFFEWGCEQLYRLETSESVYDQILHPNTLRRRQWRLYQQKLWSRKKGRNIYWMKNNIGFQWILTCTIFKIRLFQKNAPNSCLSRHVIFSNIALLGATWQTHNMKMNILTRFLLTKHIHHPIHKHDTYQTA